MVVIPHNVKPRYLAGGTWKSAKIKVKEKKQTPGKLKGESCQASAAKKFFAKRSRSYKSSGFGEFGSYSDWCAQMDSINSAKRS